MYDEERVEDSLEFCKDIKIYLEHDKNPKKFLIIQEYPRKKLVKGLDFERPYIYRDLEDVQRDMNEAKDDVFKREIKKDLVYILFCIVISFVFAYLLTHYVAHHNMVEGNSMQPTLENEDMLIVEKVSYYFRDPKRYDVVIFPASEGVNFVKRIIGLPGERIQIKNGEVYVNGGKLSDPFGMEPMEDPGIAQDEIALGVDEYFVLGDNRNASADSRKASVGIVKGEDILGRVWFRFYPFDSIGWINSKER